MFCSILKHYRFRAGLQPFGTMCPLQDMERNSVLAPNGLYMSIHRDNTDSGRPLLPVAEGHTVLRESLTLICLSDL